MPIYLDNPYYFVYEVIIYWRNNNKELKSFYKIGLIKVIREDRTLGYRYRKEIENGAKIFVVNQIKCYDYDTTSRLEDQLIKLAEKDKHNEQSENHPNGWYKCNAIGDLAEYPHYFAGSTEAFKTPNRFGDLVIKLEKHFENNPTVYYPKYFNSNLSDRIKARPL